MMAAAMETRADRVDAVPSPWAVVLAAAWRGRALAAVNDVTLSAARVMASRHLVEGWVLCAYRERFPASVLTAARQREELLASNFAEVAHRLAWAGAPAVVIKSGLEGRPQGDDSPIAAAEYGDIDLVVGRDGWGPALAAMRDWGTVDDQGLLEPHKKMVRPPRGPAAHLHRDAEWFGIPAIRADHLRVCSKPLGNGALLPTRPAALCLTVAHGIFQNLAFDLSELLEVRRLADPTTVEEAARMAEGWGWGSAFAAALRDARSASRALDEGCSIRLPVALPGLRCLREGWRHSVYLALAGDPAAALRETILRPALVVAKGRRRRLDR
jgi:hypothetical protein